MNLDVVEYEQKVSAIGNDATYSQLTFPGVSPLLMKNDQTITVVRQTGRAVTWFGRMQAPAPIFTAGTFVHLEKPDVQTHKLQSPDFAWETTWSYLMAVEQATWDAVDLVAAEKVPASPTVLT